jgi:hypothetical protein
MDTIYASTWQAEVFKGTLMAKMELDAVITCPQCGFARHEQMPPDT